MTRKRSAYLWGRIGNKLAVERLDW
jgi:hypothetical protein